MTPQRTLVFATNNEHKLREIRAIAPDMHILSLSDIQCHADIPETASTFQGNALLKARYVKQHYGYDCFADDSGLMVDALHGAPGVHSARYAGEGHDGAANTVLLLRNMHDVADRSARFVTVIALIDSEGEHLFEGSIEGSILTAPRGDGGFGYDPVFIPQGYTESFAEMSSEQKNRISHRAIATEHLLHYLSNHFTSQCK